MLAAIEVARGLGPRTLTLAVPVAPPETAAALAARVDELVCLSTPPHFRSVGQWYDAVEQTSDEEVQDLLATAWHDEAAAGGRPTGGANHERHDGHRL